LSSIEETDKEYKPDVKMPARGSGMGVGRESQIGRYDRLESEQSGRENKNANKMRSRKFIFQPCEGRREWSADQEGVGTIGNHKQGTRNIGPFLRHSRSGLLYRVSLHRLRHYSCLAKVAWFLFLGFAGTRHTSGNSDNPQYFAVHKSRGDLTNPVNRTSCHIIAKEHCRQEELQDRPISEDGSSQANTS
jgi:hypothetical protein